jgi:hypothetical protein
LKACRHAGFKPRIAKEADGAASALAFVAAGYGVAVVSEPLQKIPAKDCGFPQSDARGQSVGACGHSLEAGGGIRSSRFSNSSSCWLKPVPAETGASRPSQQSF